jgi:hypothetical protein
LSCRTTAVRETVVFGAVLPKEFQTAEEKARERVAAVNDPARIKQAAFD